MKIAIAGPPSSGNYMLKNILKACGAEWVKVCHGNNAYRLPEHDFVVVTVRGLARWIQSAEKRRRMDRGRNKFLHSHWLSANTHHDAHQFSYKAFFVEIVTHDLPFAVVSYESLVSDPDDTMTLLCEWLGLEFPGWDALPEKGAKGGFQLKPFEANAKYRAEPQPC
jgi:hypothetical protein